jgi:hypothetical protein
MSTGVGYRDCSCTVMYYLDLCWIISYSIIYAWAIEGALQDEMTVDTHVATDNYKKSTSVC